ncbi:MAG: DUF4910 domain-containing protein [Deltaproteobacteria bacterium]|nr:DUF4910 domain-containing protein [Deltaproteobacteria bacterium]
MSKNLFKHKVCGSTSKVCDDYQGLKKEFSTIPFHINSIIRHIDKLSDFDRVMCSTGYDDALNYITQNITCPAEWIRIEEYEPGAEHWGWKVPSSMNFWRDTDRPSIIEIPNHRSMKSLDVHVPGKGDREIIIVAHLDHPKPSANDNASGAAMMMELINYYVKCRPKISLRFLFTVEYFGTVAYCHRYEKELGGIMAGISLDMVGADQNISGSTLIVDEIPHHHVSSLDLLLRHRLKEVARGGNYREIGNSLPVYRCDFQYYTGGSDHYILNDATIGIPASCLNTYPDPFYHTRNDTADKISPETLKIFFTTVVHALNDVCDDDPTALNRFSQLTLNHFDEQANQILMGLTKNSTIAPDDYSFRLHHVFTVSTLRLKNIWSLASSMDSGFWQTSLRDVYQSASERFHFMSGCEPRQSGWETGRRFNRRFKAPLCRNRLFEIITATEKEEITGELQQDPLFFHKIDAALNYCGSRGTAEISRLLRMHYGGEDYEGKIDKYFRILCRYGLMEEGTDDL